MSSAAFLNFGRSQNGVLGNGLICVRRRSMQGFAESARCILVRHFYRRVRIVSFDISSLLFTLCIFIDYVQPCTCRKIILFCSVLFCSFSASRETGAHAIDQSSDSTERVI